MRMKTILPREKKARPRAVTIRTLQENAPWIIVSRAVKESGLPESEIRNLFPLRRFGNADYVRPSDLNSWILDSTMPNAPKDPSL